MTVEELLTKLNAAFPAFNAKALEAWSSVFREVLGKHEGPALKSAYTAVLSSFTPKASKALHPMPADFAPHLPSGHPRIQTGGPKLDIAGHGDKVRRLMADWRTRQGHRGANGIEEVLRALEFIAEPIASVAAWGDNPAPVVLTSKQLRLAQHRAISVQRRIDHGILPRTNEVWWEQISAIAARWGIATVYEDWAPKKPEKQEAA